MKKTQSPCESLYKPTDEFTSWLHRMRPTVAPRCWKECPRQRFVKWH